MTTPRIEAIKFRIWQFASDRNWDVTVTDIADHLDEKPQTIANVVKNAGWSSRLRAGWRDRHAFGSCIGIVSPSTVAGVVRDVLSGRMGAIE
jgi:hypothetical protein